MSRKRKLSEKEKHRISEFHRDNQFIIELPNGGKALKFHDTIILECENDKVVYYRNPKHINEATRRALKYYTHLFFQGKLVVKDWKTPEPLFVLNGVAKRMKDDELEFSINEINNN